MNCSATKRLLSSYLDGAVARKQLTQVNEHLKSCPECAANFASLQKAQSLVGSLGTEVGSGRSEPKVAGSSFARDS